MANLTEDEYEVALELLDALFLMSNNDPVPTQEMTYWYGLGYADARAGEPTKCYLIERLPDCFCCYYQAGYLAGTT
jgi:hypothetical protein